MRILVAHDVGRARTGGMSRIMGFIHDEIAAMGHNVNYFCSEDVPRTAALARFSRFHFPLALLRHVLKRAKQGKQYDIVNVHEPSGAALVAFRRLLGSTRVVVTSHGIEERGWNLRFAANVIPGNYPSWRTRTIYPATVLWQTRIALKSADHVFCLNSEDREYLMQKFNRPKESISRIFPAADPLFGRNSSGRDYNRFNTILFAGTWLARKGTPDVIAALSSLWDEHPKLRLVVLNPGLSEEALQSEFPSRFRNNIHCVVTRSDAHTAAVFEECDIFLLPSMFEGTPLTLIEAMWSGMPIICTATCGMKDVIQHEQTGLLVPVHQPDLIAASIRRLITDPSLRQSLGQNAYKMASTQFRWSKVARTVQRAYETLVNQGNSRIKKATIPNPSNSTENSGEEELLLSEEYSARNH